MTARLESFRYLPAAVDGWETPELPFGALFTAVQGANGTGKTPIMKGIMLALGHELSLPPEILQHCSRAQLKLSVDGQTVTLTRNLGDEFELLVEGADEPEVFSSPREYAQWFAAMVGADPRELTTKNSAASQLYASLVIPAFWVDQDNGWTNAYFTPINRNFIVDQRQEIIRFLTGLPPRHPFKDKTDYEKAKEDAERTEKQVDMQRFLVERLRTNGQLVDGEDVSLSRAADDHSDRTRSEQPDR